MDGFKKGEMVGTAMVPAICYETVSGRVFTVIFQRPGGRLDCSIGWTTVSGMGWNDTARLLPESVDKGIEGGRVAGIDNEE